MDDFTSTSERYTHTPCVAGATPVDGEVSAIQY
jgi:hypothetical protein